MTQITHNTLHSTPVWKTSMWKMVPKQKVLKKMVPKKRTACKQTNASKQTHSLLATCQSPLAEEATESKGGHFAKLK